MLIPQTFSDLMYVRHILVLYPHVEERVVSVPVQGDLPRFKLLDKFP